MIFSMNRFDIVSMALRSLWRRKVRTILTIFGVIIGTASIVVMLSLGIGMNESFKSQVEMMGSLNIINVDTYYYPEDMKMDMYVQPIRNTLDDATLDKIAEIKGVEAVTPLMYSYVKFVSGRYEAHVQLVGVRTDNMGAFGFKLSQGRLLSENDTNEVIFGSQIKDQFYNPKDRNWYNREEAKIDVMNDKITIDFNPYYGDQPENKIRKRLQEVKGVGMLEQGQNEKDYAVYMNVDFLKKLQKANSRNSITPGRIDYGQNSQTGYERAMVKVTRLEDVEDVQNIINEMGFGAYSLTDILRQMLDATKTIRTVLSAIGAVALFIAAIGITNTMVMSIYERTREIGIMKVLGCILSDIRKLFLLESAMIGFIGGITGIVFSYAISILLNRAGISFLNIGYSMGEQATRISIIPVWLAATAVLFASFVGIASGAYPAARAMRLSALEAIRYE